MPDVPSPDAPVRVSAVSFFNTVALIDGLADDPRVRLTRRVPSALIDDLRDGSADVALLPVIDYQRLPGLTVIPAGGIGCDGPTLTVRLFSPTPIERTRVLAVDGDSHTSVALARVVLSRVYGLMPEVVPLDRADADATRLLIGDKVITAAPDLPYQVDLGEAWKTMTGLPFVFAVWTGRAGFEPGGTAAILAAALRRGMGRVDRLVEQEALPRGWPADIARRYLTEYLKFDIGPRQLDAIRLFHRMAWEVGALDHAPTELSVVGASEPDRTT